MSTEEAVTDALQRPVGQNAESTEDVKKMLAELQGEPGASAAPKEKTTNGTEEAQEKTNVKTDSAGKEDKAEPERKDQDEDRSERPHHDRSDRGGRGRGRGARGGRGNFNNRSHKDNIKSDLTTQEESNDPVAIRKQVEFYFSDSNLPNDKFLFNQVGGSNNNAVELKVLHSFKRMRHFQPFEAIVDAMRESNFLELTDNDTSVRRREALPESLNEAADPTGIKVFEDRAMPRSVYVKGFGEEVPSTQFDIEAFFAPYGPTNAVRLRRSDTKLFKGSVFVEFENEDLQKAFLALDPAPKFREKDLQIMSKKEYCDKKVEDIKSGKVRPNTSYEYRRGGRDDRRGGGRDFKRKRDDEDDRDWRDRRESDRKNASRDDKRWGRGNRDREPWGSKGKYDKVEKDERGVPTVKATTEEDTKARRDAARAEALAKAKAIVDAENKKNNEKQNTDPVPQEVKTEPTAEAVSAGVDSTEGEAETRTGTKRARGDDEGDAEREVKKVDTKTDFEAVTET